MRIKAFNGGLSTRVDAQLIADNEARQYTNVDSDTAVLTPIKDKVLSVASINRYSYFSVTDQVWYSDSSPADFLEYKEILYKADRINAPVKILTGIEYQLGITPPTGTLVAIAASAPESIERITLTPSFDGASDLLEGAYKYKVVNKSSTTGFVSYSYFKVPVEEVTLKPVTRGGRPTNVSSTSQAGLRYATFHGRIVQTGENQVELTFEDTNADLVRVYRYFDSAWKALTSDYQTAATTVIDNTYDISANDELEEEEKITGTLQYAITYYSSRTGAESTPLLSNEVEVINGEVQITAIPASSDPQVDKIRIYRIGGNLTVFSLVTTINNGTISYLDTVIDTDIVGTILTSTENAVAPVGLKYLTESYAMLFGAVADKLRFTPIGNPDAWPESFFLDFPAPLTGISKTAIGLLIHTYYQTYLVTGTGPTAFAQQILANDQGCISHDSIQETKDTALWLSTDGICASDGSDVKVISRDKLGKQLYSSVNAILYDQVYQVQLTDGSVIALDFDRGIFKQFEYDVDYLVVANDNIYGHKNGQLYQLLSSDATLPMTYVSPEFEGAGLVEQKVYSSVRFYSTGSVTLTVYIDGIEIGVYTKTTTDSHEIKIPQDKKRGFYISFKVEGPGELRELEWLDGNANG